MVPYQRAKYTRWPTSRCGFLAKHSLVSTSFVHILEYLQNFDTQMNFLTNYTMHQINNNEIILLKSNLDCI